eukprot:scaffold251789_cov32-Prasinocladus_malaysianus.AAC.1
MKKKTPKLEFADDEFHNYSAGQFFRAKYGTDTLGPLGPRRQAKGSSGCATGVPTTFVPSCRRQYP